MFFLGQIALGDKPVNINSLATEIQGKYKDAKACMCAPTGK